MDEHPRQPARPHPNRRAAVLASVMITAGVLAVAGCSSLTGSSDPTTTPSSAAPTEPTWSPSEEPSESESASPTRTPSKSATPTAKKSPTGTPTTPSAGKSKVSAAPVSAEQIMACDITLPGGTVITQGSKGANVRALQWGLTQLDYEAFTGGPLTIDGKYNLMVEDAVGRFQANHKIPVTKTVDKTTWAMMSTQLHIWNGINRC